MSQFVESLKRLYTSGKLSLDEIKALIAPGKITKAKAGSSGKLFGAITSAEIAANYAIDKARFRIP